MVKRFIKFFISNYFFALISTVFLICYWISAYDLPFVAIRYPLVISVLTVIFIALNLFECIRKFRQQCTPDDDIHDKKKYDISFGLNKKKVVVILSTVAYGILVPIVGFWVMTFVYIGGISYYLGSRKILSTIIYAVVLTVFLYLIFGLWLGIRTPSGFLF